MTPYRVLVCDDQELMRGGLRMLLESTDDLTLAGEAENGIQAIDLATTTRPDLILMDVRMPKLDGIQATKRICAHNPDVKILMLTTFDLDEYVLAATRAGAAGFLLKDASGEETLHAMRAVLRGDRVLAPAVVDRMMQRYLAAHPTPSNDHRLTRLTDRERDVLTLVAQGLNNTEIAEQLFIGITTVKTHLGRILNKLEVRDRLHAVVFAYEHGLITPSNRSEPHH
ncbi:LuxR family two component transcriptional regulator [Amycolatopsis sulphurea]|uniref:LuxR family two component transcriptional regulator n=1 Tax=Amycolatopsis sulphurea TaxID=76022 RepID=A0A2A9F911_9PSEU|nr:response regulator transcription factor [Amycolatopsis sulphurea]PFG47917.1 LuxR family two component transcriptional regulator [Amycolatopsis sulphurea]